MADQTKNSKALQAEQRKARLAEQLRANLRKRKQIRNSTDAGHPADDEGLDDQGGR